MKRVLLAQAREQREEAGCRGFSSELSFAQWANLPDGGCQTPPSWITIFETSAETLSTESMMSCDDGKTDAALLSLVRFRIRPRAP